MSKIDTTAMLIAGNELAVREATNHNDGPMVKEFLNSVGLPEGYAWCQAFVYWCHKEAADRLDQKNPMKQTGGVADEWSSAAGERITTPEIACQFFIIHPDGTGHTGIVTGVFPGGILHTIEGNTNDNGSREGIGVFRNMNRNVSQMKGFKRYADLPL